MRSSDKNIDIDIPFDVQQEDETSFPWTFVGEAGDPSVITVGAFVIATNERSASAREFRRTLAGSRGPSQLSTTSESAEKVR